jgi:uncharacterized protein
MKLDNKRILLTGASTGIGKALLEELKKFDVKIVVGDLEPHMIEDIPGKVLSMKCDVSRPENIDLLFSFAMNEMEGIDICIANAGFAYYEILDTEDWEHIERIYRVNVFAPVYCMEKMRSLNIDREYCVAVTASAMAKLALPGYALYSSTKSAVDSFAYAYRFEENPNAHITIIYPIATKTEFFKTAGENTPVPFPAQTAGHVARCIVKGIRRNKKSVYPSRLFYFIMQLNRILPFVLFLYAKMEQRKMKQTLMKGK